jgi:hypothetical protein
VHFQLAPPCGGYHAVLTLTASTPYSFRPWNSRSTRNLNALPTYSILLHTPNSSGTTILPLFRPTAGPGAYQVMAIHRPTDTPNCEKNDNFNTVQIHVWAKGISNKRQQGIAMSFSTFYIVQLSNGHCVEHIMRGTSPVAEGQHILPYHIEQDSPCVHNLPTPCPPSTPILVQLTLSIDRPSTYWTTSTVLPLLKPLAPSGVVDTIIRSTYADYAILKELTSWT